VAGHPRRGLGQIVAGHVDAGYVDRLQPDVSHAKGLRMADRLAATHLTRYVNRSTYRVRTFRLISHR
jgi:hypothetical protein